MDLPRLSSGVGEDNVGIPDDLRCKRSDGKQWRCTAMSMPDKTVCEKHYIQAKKRAANSAIRANMKKIKRRSIGESDIYLESKSDDMDIALSSQFGDYSGSSGKKKKENTAKGQGNHSPEIPSGRSLSARSSLRSTDDLDLDGSEYEESQRSYRTPPHAMDSSRSRSQKAFDASPMTETSDGSLDSSDDVRGQTCHQCRQDVTDVILCLKCNRRGYCESCISTWYSNISMEEIQRVCPACRGICSCRFCLRGDNVIKARIREIPAKEKLQYLYCILSAVLPIVKHIHSEQCSEVELEKKLRGNKIDLIRTKINADEQMCCDSCRIPIIDYHRHCTNCSYDLCLSCCKDLRKASESSELERKRIPSNFGDQDELTVNEKVNLSDIKLNSFKKNPGWKANPDGSISCPTKEHGGCGSCILNLKRIFKMNWVAKLVKNVEEMVNGCRVYNSGISRETGFSLTACQAASREKDDDNFLYYPSSHDINNGGTEDFRSEWSHGKPVIIKEVFDNSSSPLWDPMVIWGGIKKTAEEKAKDAKSSVKAVDCFDRNEISIELGEFMRGYFDGYIHEDGRPKLLKLKDWPSPNASEEFLLCQRSDFINKLPLLEFIHSKWGFLNIAARLPHYSLQNDVGPRIFISYGIEEEINGNDSTNNLHLNMRDMVFLLVHSCKAELKGVETTPEMLGERSDNEEQCIDSESHLKTLADRENGLVSEFNSNGIDTRVDQETEGNCLLEEKGVSCASNTCGEEKLDRAQGGALWDVFRRQDRLKLIEYIRLHWKEFGKTDSIINYNVSRPLYDGVIYLNRHHRRLLKEEFGVEPWSFTQHVGEAVFIPAGCPSQMRNIQSTVQLGLDFLSPESLSESVRLFEEIRGLPNDHDSKHQILEVGKMSLYAASSAIKEVQKLVLDPKFGPELGFEDPNLTSFVSKNLEDLVQQRQVSHS